MRYHSIGILLLVIVFSSYILSSECQNISTDFPKILLFKFDPVEIPAGNSTKLSWVVENADRVYIVPKIYMSNDSTSSELPKQGDKKINPTRTTIYTLTAEREIQDKEKELSTAALVKVIRIYIKDENKISANTNTSSFDILNVKDEEHASRFITLIGACPSNFTDDLWVFVVAPNGYFYPQTINASDDRWRTPIIRDKWEMRIGLGLSEETEKFFSIILAVADEQASNVISKTLKEWAQKGYYPGWKMLPPGVQEVKRIDVVRSAETYAEPPEISDINLPGDVNFTNVKENSTVPWQMDLIGNCSNGLKDNIWILVRPCNSHGQWYPQSINPCGGIHVQKAGKKWRVMGTFGAENGNRNEPFDIVAILANETANRFFDAKQREWCENRETYPGLLTIELPSGIEEKDRIRVIRR